MSTTREPADGKRVYFASFGCQMNKLDGELALSALRSAGYARADSPEDADVALFNTCSVRRHAEEKVYSHIGGLKRIKERRPDFLVGVMGCMAQKEGEQLARRAPLVDFVIGTRMFLHVADIIEQAHGADGPIVVTDEESAIRYHRAVGHRPNPFQAYVAAMRGCDNFCSYCIVPTVRGREVSRPIADVVDEAKRLADDGVVEVTLLGQNVNSYGKGLAEGVRLPQLLAKLDAVEGLERLRFITSHPKDVTREILEVMRDLPTVCEYLHMPAQSGSDRVLKAMRRGYTGARYRELIAMAREIVPGIALSSDFIVGFPGETEEDFAQTAALVRAGRFQNSFVFKYSPRPGTKAADLDDDVPWPEKRRRNGELLAIQETISLAAHREMIGRTVEVLVEGTSRRDAAMLIGRMRTNHIVHFPGGDSERGALRRVRIADCTPLTLRGELVAEER